MSVHPNKFRPERRGSNAVEFALTLPIFIGLMFIIIDFGWYFANKAILDIAVHSGCREGALVDPLSGAFAMAAQNEIDRIVAIVPQSCSQNCDIQITSIGNVPSRSVVCSISADFQPLVGFSVMTGSGSFGYGLPDQLQARTQMRFEWQRTQ
jgi:Flp pilus assembly protein TadG